MASRSCDLRPSAVGAGDAEDDESSTVPLVFLIFREDTKRGEDEAENASFPAINSARSVENKSKSHIICFITTDVPTST